MTDSLIGKKVGQFEITALLGHGGMADVYRAYQPSMKREVAIKVLSNTLTKSSTFAARFDREVELVANLEHAHIIPVYEHGTTEDGLTYLAMRFIKGGTLSERIGKEPALTLDQTNSILLQVASALDYAHQKGVTHRDIKPSNVLLDDQGNAYLADFGLAQIAEVDPRSNLTRTGTLVGTPTYISPEQALESRSDFRSDLYSLGIVLYETLAGKPPFTGDSIFQIMQAHVSEPPPLLLKQRPDLPIAIEAVIQKSLAKKPEDRYQNAADMARDFALALQGSLSTPMSLRLPTHASGSLSTLTGGLLSQSGARLFAAGVIGLALLVFGLIFVPRLVAPTPIPTETPTPTLTPTATPTNTPPPPTPTPVALAFENLRPDSGTPDSLVLTANDIRIAQSKLQGSFVGIAACTLETEYHASLIAAARTSARSLGFEVRVENANNSAARQSAIINQFIAEGARAIFVCELDLNVIRAAMTRAQEAGIVTIMNSDKVLGRASVSFTVTNQQMGETVGEYAAEVINKERGGKANVIILDYPSYPQLVTRADGMENALKKGAPDVNIVGRFLGGLPQNGEESVRRILQQFPNVDAILSINDAGAFGAVTALREAGKGPKDVMIFGVDAEQETRRLMVEGEYFRGSFDTDPTRLASLGINAIVKMLAGGVVPRQIYMTGKMITPDSLLALTPTAAPK